jgi:hypothetical protein
MPFVGYAVFSFF